MKTLRKLPWKRIIVVVSIAAIWTLLVTWLHDRRVKFLTDPESYAQDLMMQVGRKTAPDTNLVFVGITQPSYADARPEDDPELRNSPALLAMRENWPWPRSVWAEVINRLAEAGASVIALDLVFAAESEFDEPLAAAVERHRDKVVIASMQSEGGKTLTQPSRSILPFAESGTSAFDGRVGYITLKADEDGVIRRHRYAFPDAEFWEIKIKTPYHESFAARILRKQGKAGDIPFDTEPRRFRYTAAPSEFWKPIPVNMIFIPGIWSNNFANGSAFKGKTVVVGPAHNIFHDEHPTPFMRGHGQMLGPEIHLNIINAAAQNEFLAELSPEAEQYVIAGAGLLAALLGLAMPLAGGRLILSGVAVLIYAYVVQWLFDHRNCVIPSIAPITAFSVISLSTFAYDFVMERLARLKLRATMEFYFSPKVLMVVIANPGSMEPREADVTLLLTDLRNSTPLAEKLGPQGMFKLLNRIFEAQTNVIMDEDGNLEHFLGDQFLSYWGAPQDQPDSADRALRAARKLITAMEAVKESLEPDIKALFGYGVALHHGPVLVGNKGSSKRLDYGLVGDTVNAAARIESLTKYYGVKLLVSGDFLSRLKTPASTRRIDHVIVKGKSHPVELHQVALEANPQWDQLCQRFAAAYRDYEAGQFALAKSAFEQLSKDHSDPVSRVFVERCQLLESKPRANWTGVWEMDRK